MTRVRSGRTHLQSFRLLIAHVVGTAAVFVTLITVGWLVSLCLEYLNTIHRFPPQVYTLAGRLEIWLFYLDSMLSGFSFVVGFVDFTLYLLEGTR
jgi:hypothetical protein